MDHKLLNPVDHPDWTRILMDNSNISSRVEAVEITIVEWSPSAHFVKLQSPKGNSFWREVTEYGPVCIEILPKEIDP